MPALLTTPTQTQIVNRAAALLGSTSRIEAISQADSTLAQHARAHWDAAVRLVLTDHPWNFAIARQLIEAETAAPAFGHDFAYRLPADCLRWLPPNPEDGLDYYEALNEGGLLLTNAESPLPVRYISAALGSAVNLWPAHFEDAMVNHLAAMLAEPITQSESVQDRAEKRAEGSRRRAKRVDGLSTGPRQRTRISTGSAWLSAGRQPYDPYGR